MSLGLLFRLPRYRSPCIKKLRSFPYLISFFLAFGFGSGVVEQTSFFGDFLRSESILRLVDQVVDGFLELVVGTDVLEWECNEEMCRAYPFQPAQAI